VLDFVDARTKKLVFRGVGKAVVGGPESNARKIQEAVAKIVAAVACGGNPLRPGPDHKGSKTPEGWGQDSSKNHRLLNDARLAFNELDAP
jgi:hypothetical protein